MNENENDIPGNATIREEYVRCGNSNCQKCNIDDSGGSQEKQRFHDPYLYAYWKQDKKLKKIYIGKSWEDYRNSKIAKQIGLTAAQYRKSKFVRDEACRGNPLAIQYLERSKNHGVGIDWSYRVIINSNREQRMLKMLAIADQKHLNHDHETELIDIIASEMQRQGLDPTNEDNFDSYLNSNII